MDRERIEKLLKYVLIPKWKKKQFRNKKKSKKFEPQLKITWYEDGSMHIEGKDVKTEMPPL